MALSTALEDHTQKIGRFEWIIAGAIFIFPMEGCFQPLDGWLKPPALENVYTALYAPLPPYQTDSRIHVITLAVLLFLCLANWRGMWREARLMLPVLALVGWIFASAIWSIDPINTLHRASRMVDHVAFATYLVARFSWREMIALFTRCYGLIFVMTIAVMLIVPHMGYGNHEGYTDAWRGAFLDKNFLGAAAAMGVLISGYSFFAGANNRAFAAFVCLGQLFLLAMARSATSTVTLLIALGVALAAFGLSSHQRPVARLFALMTMLVGAVAGIILLISYDSIGEMMGRSRDLSGRTAIWHYALQAIESRPWLGYGYGFWGVASVPRLDMWMAKGWPMPHAHEEYLDVTLQTGIIGLCLEVFCLALALTRAVRFSFVLADGKGLLCGLMIVALCARGVTETVLTDPTINGCIWLVIPFLALAHMTKEQVPLPAYRVVAAVREQQS